MHASELHGNIINGIRKKCVKQISERYTGNFNTWLEGLFINVYANSENEIKLTAISCLGHLFRYGLRVNAYIYTRVKPKTRTESYVPAREIAGFIRPAREREKGAVDKIFFVWWANKLLTSIRDDYTCRGHYR